MAKSPKRTIPLGLIIGLIAALALLSSHRAASAQMLPVSSNLRIWLDAEDVNGDGSVLADGTILSQWKDKSGHGHHMVSTRNNIVSYEATGLNGRPSVRLPVLGTLTGPNIFPGTTAPEMTMFLVNSREATLAAFTINLNGQTTGSSGVNARFSLHLPWSNGYLYFDAGGCCSTTRQLHKFAPVIGQPNLVVAGNSVNGYSGMTGVNQFVRVDATLRTADATAIAGSVVNGLHLGTTNQNPWNGRFSEILIYDRALSLTEIQEVECYLDAKWNIPGIPNTACGGEPVALGVTKSSSLFAAAGAGAFEIPGSEVIYSIEVSHLSGDLFDSDSLFLVDHLPEDVEFFNGDLDGATGPFTDAVGFTNSGSNLTWSYASNVGFASGTIAPTSLAQCSYAPVAGYDPNVKFICMAPGGSIETGHANFKFRARIK